MKKRATLLLAIALVLTACGSSSSTVSYSSESAENKVVDNRDSKNEDTTNHDSEKSNNTVVDNRQVAEEVSDADFDVSGKIFENTIGDTLYFVTVKNNSNSNVFVDGSGLAKDSSDNVIGEGSGSIDILGPGETSILYFYFDSVKDVDHVDYDLTYETSTRYTPIISNISLEQTINDRNLTLLATNTGSVDAEFVQAYALFCNAEGNIISYSSSYITDDDSMIKPGATISAQLDCYQDFDHVECYLTGRSTGSSSVASAGLSEQDFSITEYPYENSIGDTLYFLIVKNNSDKEAKISSNATAFDSSENVIGAADCSIDVIGPGEESIAYFYFDSVKNIDHVDYNVSYSESDYYESVLSDLEVVQNINDSNVVVSVTNTGDKAAQFVQAYALFFDANNNIVGYESAYITDDDSEIKPGATINKQLDTYNSFDHVECYFTGRR
ncbi:hypothetical protein [Butyrivibrio sp. WCD2001]|uniref:hypothetical protein n=1 Tax=Butyrivibrio sp. WCD2001 TaxID=1280681 RepID=UPI000418FFDC|nr:hypothetical protein [Butyrivibrio sp. WCD2001]